MTAQSKAVQVRVKARKGKVREESARYQTDQADAPITNAYIRKRSLTVRHDANELLLTIEEVTS
jgi:hypothetical protein